MGKATRNLGVATEIQRDNVLIISLQRPLS
jgi:hypothetical protein